MSFSPAKRCRDARGFTLIELLVVILIIGILAAIAIPAFLNQKTKGNDAVAKAQARTAATAAETYATDHSGEYGSMTLEALQEVEPTLKDTSRAKLSVGTVSTNAYEVTSEATATKDKFTIKKLSTGVVERKCEPASKTNKGACPNGEVGTPGTW